MSREWPVPPKAGTIHVMSELHFGLANQTERRQAIIDDFASGRVPIPEAHLILGDVTNSSAAAEDTSVLAWIATLPAPRYVIPGNQDLLGRTASAFATAYSQGVNQLVNLGYANLLLLSLAGPSAADGSALPALDDATLVWLEEQLAGSTKKCWIACHTPLQATVLGSSWSSLTPGFWTDPSDQIAAILSHYTNAKVWLGAHTHSPISAPDLVKGSHPVSYGRKVISVTTPGIAYTGPTADSFDPIQSLFLTNADDGIDVRVRDHGGRVWDSVDRLRTACPRDAF